MKRRDSLIRLSVAMLLVIVLGVGGGGVGEAFGRIELHSEAGNVDGDPGDGHESIGGCGSTGGVYVQPSETESLSTTYFMPVFIGYIGLNDAFLLDVIAGYWKLEFSVVEKTYMEGPK